MKMLPTQNTVDAVIPQSIQGGSGTDADGIKIPQTKEELELLHSSLVAEAQLLLYSIQNRQEDFRFEESSLTLLDSEETLIILKIGSHAVDHEAPKTLGKGRGAMGNLAEVALKSETKNEVKTEFNQAQRPQTSDAPLDLMQKRPMSKSEVKTEINQAHQPQTSDADKIDFDDLGASDHRVSGQSQQPDCKVQSLEGNSGMDSISDIDTYTFEGFSQAHPIKAEELIGKLTEVTGITERSILYKAYDQSRKSDPTQCYNATIAIEWLLQLQLSEWEQTSARTSLVQKCDRTHKWIATQPLKPSAANDNILPCGPVNKNEPDCVKEKTEEFIPLEFMITSQNSSGFPTIVGQIFGHLDFDTLVSCRLVSKDFNNFLDDKTFWIACLDQVRKEYLDKLLVEGNLPKPKCQLVNIMSPKDVKKDYNSWITLIEIIKAKECIEDLINFTKLIKQSEELIQSFASFCPIRFMFAFWATGHPRWVPGFKNLPFNRIKIFKKFVNLDMFEEDDLIEMQWDYLIEMVCRSENPEVVSFFTSKLMNVDSIKARNDIKHFEEQMDRWREENRQLFEAWQRRKNNFISPLTLYYGISCAVVFASCHIPGLIRRFF